MKTRKRQGKEEKGKGKGKKVQGKREAVQRKGRADARITLRRLPRVPPPDSDVWPPEYRGERWKPAYAILFAGKCLLCQYSCQQPKSRRMRDRWLRQDTPLLCTNHPCSPGELREVLGTDTCRNFKMKHTLPTRRKPTEPDRSLPKRKKGVRRVPLSQGLFATVDAADYRTISQYKWSVSRVGKKLYACTRINGRTVAMHRFLLRPRKGYQVDHIDGNGLNNCRSNLRVCTPAQNQANRRPSGGSSRFVGVSRHAGKWEAKIVYRGKRFYLGRFDDEVEAAKARDRKAVELHGPYAYLNFPEDWTFNKNGVGHPMVGGTGIEGQ